MRRAAVVVVRMETLEIGIWKTSPPANRYKLRMSLWTGFKWRMESGFHNQPARVRISCVCLLCVSFAAKIVSKFPEEVGDEEE